MSGDATADAATRARLLALAVAAGSVDAVSYLGLGHAFPANMTGNTVLLAIALARGTSTDLLHAAISLGGFSLGVIAGALTIDRDRPWPAGARGALAVHSIVLLAVAVAWALSPGASSATREVLLGAAGLTMGLQSVAVLAANTSGIATTYVTGTLTQAIARQVVHFTTAREDARSRRTRRLAELDWIFYGAGALLGALLELHARAWAYALPTALTVLALGPMRLGRRGTRRVV